MLKERQLKRSAFITAGHSCMPVIGKFAVRQTYCR
jgi:hypothetical protein